MHAYGDELLCSPWVGQVHVCSTAAPVEVSRGRGEGWARGAIQAVEGSLQGFQLLHAKSQFSFLNSSVMYINPYQLVASSSVEHVQFLQCAKSLCSIERTSCCIIAF